MSKMKDMLARLLLAALLAGAAGQAAAGPSYQVRVDTASLGTGPAFMGMYFMGLADATPATATVSKLAGDLVGAPGTTGGVTGAAPGPLVFSNAGGGSDWVQAVMLGGVFSFDVDFMVGAGDAGSTFGWALFNDSSYLGADGDLGTVSVQPVAGGNPQFALLTASPLVSVQVVPEPATAWLFLLTGMTLLVFTRRRS